MFFHAMIIWISYEVAFDLLSWTVVVSSLVLAVMIDGNNHEKVKDDYGLMWLQLFDKPYVGIVLEATGDVM